MSGTHRGAQRLAGATHPPRHARRLASLGVLLGLLLLAGITTASPPALAHDQLVESVPAVGANLPAPPGQITLRFSADLIPLGTEIRVTDEQGRDWVDGTPVVSERTVTQALQAGAVNGLFTIRWRVVSSDGHPISGRHTYSVVASPPTTTAATANAPASSAPTTGESTRASAASASAASSFLPWLGGLIGLGATLAVAWWLWRRRTT